jgi:hypothetical protein
MNRFLKKGAILHENRNFESWQSIRRLVSETGILVLNHEMPLNSSNIQTLFNNGIFCARTNSRMDEPSELGRPPRLGSVQGHERVIGIFARKFSACSS